MGRIQGMGSNRSTNRPTGGGPRKQGLPSTIGRPANLMRFISIQSSPGVPSAPSAPSAACTTITNVLGNVNDATKVDFFQAQNPTIDFSLIQIGWKIFNGDFNLTITNIGISGPGPEQSFTYTYTKNSGTVPATPGDNITVTFSNC